MIMRKWTGFERYIVMADRSNKLKHDYTAFNEFQRVKEALMKISNCYTQTYQFGIDVYDKKITSTQAKIALENIENCIYSSAIRQVATQIGARI